MKGEAEDTIKLNRNARKLIAPPRYISSEQRKGYDGFSSIPLPVSSNIPLHHPSSGPFY